MTKDRVILGASLRLDGHTCGALWLEIQVTKRCDSFSAHYCTPIKIPAYIHNHLWSIHKWKACSHRSYLVMFDIQTGLEIDSVVKSLQGMLGEFGMRKPLLKNYTTDMTDR